LNNFSCHHVVIYLEGTFYPDEFRRYGNLGSVEKDSELATKYWLDVKAAVSSRG